VSGDLLGRPEPIILGKEEEMKNRKTVSCILFAVMLLAIISYPAFGKIGKAVADSAGSNAEFVIGMDQYFVNNQLPGISMDAAPYIDNGRTLVPVRYLADALGATTTWDGNTQEVTVSTAVYNIGMTIGSATLTVDGQAQTMDVAPVINNGRTYLPARDVANALGFSVDWDAANKIVVIYPMSSIGEPAYNNVITQAQQNAAKPEQVQKLESALGVTMTGSAASGGWDYNPELNADGSSNSAFIAQNMSNSFVVVGYGSSDDEVDVAIKCTSMVGNLSTVANVDISPLQKVLEAFIPGQDADIQQLMAYAQECANYKTHGGNLPPALRMTIDGMTVAVGQGNGTTFASLEILGS
jgi:hypothetical protein